MIASIDEALTKMYAIVAALRHWSMHLMYAKHTVIINTNHVSLKFLLSQPKLTGKQTRWFAFLSTFADVELRHEQLRGGCAFMTS